MENKFRKKLGKNSKLYSSKTLLEQNFKENKSFNFIQVGANDGVSFDFLYNFLLNRKSSGIVIEPIKEYYDELVNNYSEYPKIKAINKAIHPSEKSIYLYRIAPNLASKYPDWVKGIASLDPEHHKKTNIKTEDIIEELVSAETLMNTINENYFNQVIDYFQVDTEGFDYEILKMIDFTKINPKIIKFESVNLSDSDKIDANELLKINGYYLFNEYGDTVAVNLKLVNLF